MRIDIEQACTVFSIMFEQYRALNHPFINLEKDLPQTHVLPEIQADKLRFAQHLFFSCHYMRGTVISSLAFKLLNQMQQEQPWLFRLEEVCLAQREEIEVTLGRYIPWQKKQVSMLWQNNARQLAERWGGDPRNIFKGSPDKEELYRRVMGKKYIEYHMVDGKRRRIPPRYEGFGGFKEKMASMLAYFLSATKLIKLTDLSAPVDFHHLRIYLATGMIVCDTDVVRYEDITETGIRLAERLQALFGLTPVEYGDIVWLWSLRSCRASPHNASKKVILHGRKMKQIVPVTWTPGQIRKYEKTCGLCAISEHCSFGVPPGPYYKTGKLMLVDKKDGPPQRNLFSPGEFTFDQLTPRRPKTPAQLNEVLFLPFQQETLF